MQFSNFHTHTLFSDGKNTVEENIQYALTHNMQALGFSDHSFTDFDTSYCMMPEDFEPYLACISEAKKQYADRIQIYAGLELDYFSQEDTSALDYWIASVHSIHRNGVYYSLDSTPEIQQTCIQDAFSGNVIDFAKCYFDMVTEVVDRTKPAFVGHFDLINKFSLMPVHAEEYQKAAVDALQQVLKICPYIELNTGAMSRGWRTTPYPEDFLLKTILESGGQMILSSDSHKKEHLTYSFSESIALLKEIGFTSLCRFDSGNMVSYKI